MPLDDRSGDVEIHTLRAKVMARSVMRLIPWLKNERLFIYGDADSVVANDDLHGSIHVPYSDVDVLPNRRILERVLQQDVDHLREPLFVGKHGQWRRGVKAKRMIRSTA